LALLCHKRNHVLAEQKLSILSTLPTGNTNANLPTIIGNKLSLLTLYTVHKHFQVCFNTNITKIHKDLTNLQVSIFHLNVHEQKYQSVTNTSIIKDHVQSKLD